VVDLGPHEMRRAQRENDVRRIESVVTNIGAAAALLVLPALANAQFDHMRCFKIKDSAKFDAQASLTSLQQQFGLDENCTIKGKGKMFCVPTSKTLTGFIDKSKDGIPQVDLDGDELAFDSICYKVKCPKREIAPEVVTDQFGTRTVEKFKSALLCAPAVKGVPPTTSTTTTISTTTTSTTTTTIDCSQVLCPTPNCGAGEYAVVPDGECCSVCVAPAFCGGIGGISCSAGLTCVEDPNSSCRQDCANSDCGGICVEVPVPTPPCGGILGLTCTGSQICVGIAGDQCDALCGGVDCDGECVEIPVP